MVGHLLNSAHRLTTDVNSICARSGGFNSVDEYNRACDVTHRIHLIKRPLFFLSAEDDPFFGKRVIPVDHACENVLVGVTKRGAHCSYFGGDGLAALFPFK